MAKRLWAEEADERVRYGKGFHWVESPVIQAYMNQNITGDPRLNWIAYSVSKYLRNDGSPRVLSLGCGGGVFERDLINILPNARVQGIDFSPGAIALAQRRAKEACLDIDYRVADLNEVFLEPQTFDAVFAAGALHHIAAVEHLLRQVRESLAPGGVLIVNEYVGPNQLQWTPTQVEMINEILAILPDRYKRRISNPAEYKRQFLGPSPVEEMNRNDPTEAAHSEDIVPGVRRLFRLMELKPFGGTILHMLFQDIIGNFRFGDDVDDCILRLICNLEWRLITSGALTSDFVYIAARPS